MLSKLCQNIRQGPSVVWLPWVVVLNHMFASVGVRNPLHYSPTLCPIVRRGTFCDIPELFMQTSLGPRSHPGATLVFKT